MNGKLLIAGGCNFPGTPASEGGKKKYYQGIYAAEMNPDTLFFGNKVGELPVPAAYGVSVSCADGIICAGGMNEHGALTTVYKIQWNEKKGKVSLETLPDLPYALDNMYGTLVGNQLFITGGNRNGKPSNSFLSLDLDNLAAGWHEYSSSVPDNIKITKPVSTYGVGSLRPLTASLPHFPLMAIVTRPLSVNGLP